MRVAFVTCSALPAGWEDDHAAARLLGAEYHAWDAVGVDWAAYDRVVIRSAWDYTKRPGEFLAWCEHVGPQRLRNAPGLVSFNADKRYLAELSVPTVPTVFVEASGASADLQGEVVVKPNISAGARDTGRFGPAAYPQAHALIAGIVASGRVALVQPYLSSVDERGETALIFLAGGLSHVVRKRAFLAPDEVAPLAEGNHAPAKAMLSEDLVVPGTADAAELALARSLISEVSDRFGTPLFARVDLVRGDDGQPVLLELEAIEPVLYLAGAAGAAQSFADAVRVS
jgi:hypothetical protein